MRDRRRTGGAGGGGGGAGGGTGGVGADSDVVLWTAVSRRRCDALLDVDAGHAVLGGGRTTVNSGDECCCRDGNGGGGSGCIPHPPRADCISHPPRSPNRNMPMRTGIVDTVVRDPQPENVMLSRPCNQPRLPQIFVAECTECWQSFVMYRDLGVLEGFGMQRRNDPGPVSTPDFLLMGTQQFRFLKSWQDALHKIDKTSEFSRASFRLEV